MKGSWKNHRVKPEELKLSRGEAMTGGLTTLKDITLWRGGTKAEGRGRNYWNNIKRREDAETVRKQVAKSKVKPRKLERNIHIQQWWIYSIFPSLSCRNSNDVFLPIRSQLFCSALTRTDKLLKILFLFTSLFLLRRLWMVPAQTMYMTYGLINSVHVARKCKGVK